MSASIAADQVEPLRAVLCYSDGRTRTVPVFTPAPVAIVEHADREFAPAQGQRRFGFAGPGPQNLLRYAETEVIEATFRCGRCGCCPPVAYLPRPIASNRLPRLLPSEFAGPAWVLCFSCYEVTQRSEPRERPRPRALPGDGRWDWRERGRSDDPRGSARGATDRRSSAPLPKAGGAARGAVRGARMEGTPRRSGLDPVRDAHPLMARARGASAELPLSLVPSVEPSARNGQLGGEHPVGEAGRDRAARSSPEVPAAVREAWVPVIQSVLRQVDPHGLLAERDVPAAYADQALVLSWSIEGPADLTLEGLADGARRAFGRESDRSPALADAYARVAARLLSELTIPAP